MAADAAPPPRVLIVDDHPDNVEVLRARLEAMGYRTVCAGDGEEALDKVHASPPDLILLDVMMPRLDGNEVARRIKADKNLPFIPIIMQTALDSVENKVEGLGAGADDYITKPINFDELQARVRAMLRIKSLQDELKRRERDLATANAKLTRIAVTDGLTGLYNRRHLEQRLREMFDHSLRLHEPLAVVMFDLDHFKSINDTFGHQAGDEVLRDLATLLRQAVREIDRIGRYGGEEFMAILPGTVLDAAVTFAERARQEVEEHLFRCAAGTLRCTLSCGVAAWPHPRIRHREDLVKAADDALYVAKALGRNKVVRFDSAEFNAHSKDIDEQRASGVASRGGEAGEDGDGGEYLAGQAV
ncbi:MAG TPA: diguanylate cyclase [Gemmatimonadaceae bacterium]|nr:diguanylate cyclase [Gemmatimonadaceae bacterium]